MHHPALLLIVALAGASPAPDSVWYQGHVLKDLTADGRPDSLALTARGPDIDNLVVSLEIWSRGDMILRDTWPSFMYFHYPPPGGVRAWTHEEKLAEVSRRWGEFFEGTAFRPVSSMDTVPPPGIEPEGAPYYIAFELGCRPVLDSLLALGLDSASSVGPARRAGWRMPRDHSRVLEIWRDIRPMDPVSFTYFRGGEDRRMIAWSRTEGRFFTVYSCC